MNIVFFFYFGFIVFDIVGFFDVLSCLFGVDVVFIVKEIGFVFNDNDVFYIVVMESFV